MSALLSVVAVVGASLLPCAFAQEAPTASVNLQVTITHADGKVRTGKVLKVERSEDWYAENGWTDSPSKLTVTLEGKGTEVEKAWKDISTVEISYRKEDVDCQFDSSFSPILYMCVVQTTTKVKAADGSLWEGASRHKWRFHFTSGEPEEFWIMKVPERAQEETVATLGDGSTQNSELYMTLQARLAERMKTAVTKIEIKPL